MEEKNNGLHCGNEDRLERCKTRNSGKFNHMEGVRSLSADRLRWTTLRPLENQGRGDYQRGLHREDTLSVCQQSCLGQVGVLGGGMPKNDLRIPHLKDRVHLS